MQSSKEYTFFIHYQIIESSAQNQCCRSPFCFSTKPYMVVSV